VEPQLESVSLGLRKHLERPNKRIDAAYFPESGFASVVAVQRGKEVEVSTGAAHLAELTADRIGDEIPLRVGMFWIEAPGKRPQPPAGGAK
jgi:hypothetical protein